jgi:hypothetical protein
MPPDHRGATILEIRDGKIARETIYYDHLRRLPGEADRTRAGQRTSAAADSSSRR